MISQICLFREWFGSTARIECEVRSLRGDDGPWVVVLAAGLDAGQPTAVRSEGPYSGLQQAQSFCAAIVEGLLGQGYERREEPVIWRLHGQAHLRQLRAGTDQRYGQTQGHPIS